MRDHDRRNAYPIDRLNYIRQTALINAIKNLVHQKKVEPLVVVSVQVYQLVHGKDNRKLESAHLTNAKFADTSDLHAITKNGHTDLVTNLTTLQ